MTGIGRCLVFVLSLIILPLELYGYNKEYIKCSKMKKGGQTRLCSFVLDFVHILLF